MASCECEIVNDELVITLAEDTVGWRGKPDGVRPVKAIANPTHESCIVLLDYMHRPKSTFRNVVCVAPDGGILWRSELPEKGGAESYVDMDVADDQVVAWSWSGYFVKLDPESGRMVSKEFTK